MENTVTRFTSSKIEIQELISNLPERDIIFEVWVRVPFDGPLGLRSPGHPFALFQSVAHLSGSNICAKIAF
jgi:hypothetical protein